MADTSYPSSTPLFLSTSSGLSEGYAAKSGASSLSTGDLRRRYDFSERFSELAIDQTPFSDSCHNWLKSQLTPLHLNSQKSVSHG